MSVMTIRGLVALWDVRIFMTDEAEVSVLQFDVFELDISRGELRTVGTVISLQPQPFKVLALLASHSGQTVTRGEIRKQLWGSEIFVDFEGSLNFCIRQIRKALDEDAKSPRYIETLRGRGYRFVAPVRRAGCSGTPVSPIVPGPASRNGQPRPITVAVLPFRELSCPEHPDSLGDGITELLITYFSKNSSVRVVSRTSTMRYKHTDKSVPKIAREIGADRVVEGAVLHSGGRVRIAARLINSSTDQSEWAGCYEAEMQDWLELQDAVAQAVMRDTALHLDLRLEENGISSGRASSGSNTAYFQAFQFPPFRSPTKCLVADRNPYLR